MVYLKQWFWWLRYPLKCFEAHSTCSSFSGCKSTQTNLRQLSFPRHFTVFINFLFTTSENLLFPFYFEGFDALLRSIPSILLNKRQGEVMPKDVFHHSQHQRSQIRGGGLKDKTFYRTLSLDTVAAEKEQSQL